MNVVEALIVVMTMQIATTLKGVIPALAILVTLATGLLATVSSSIFPITTATASQPDIICTNIRHK